tara:strand:+ start:12592 stop:13179 length:588 start_codon:yes stop_codon:yes gene_type:complete
MHPSSKIILASKSPRRKKILNLIGLDFIIKPSNVDEHLNLDLTPEDFVQYWSKKKAEKISVVNKNKLIIGADTIVSLDGKILGKPKNKEQSYFMLKNLSGQTHKVITGVTIINKQKNILRTFSETTKVYVKDITNNDIIYYINNYSTLDKAGGYGIQDWFTIWIKKIDGCFYNVMGFPLSKFYKNYIELENVKNK